MNKEINQSPNILWICTDQQRYDTLRCYGNEWVQTPGLDWLTNQGVVFEHAYSQSTICTPSRASFLTSRYPRTTRCRQNGQSIPPDEVLIPRILAEHGYICGLSGKLHVSACHPSVCKGMERRINDGYHDFHWSHDPYPNWTTNEYLLWLREQNQTFGSQEHPCSSHVRYGMPEPYHQTTWCVQQALNFIEAHQESESPWLYSINLFDPHHGFDPPKTYLDKYFDCIDSIPLPNCTPDEWDRKTIFQERDSHGAYNTPGYLAYQEMTDQDHKWLRAAYWAMCELIDHQVKRLWHALEHTNQLHNTLIIFMSDHGEMLGDHGVYLKGPHLYDPAVHVPLLMAKPGLIPAGKRYSHLVELVDIAPTVLDIIGIPHHPGMQGKSMLPLFTHNMQASHREHVYCEYYNGMHNHQNPMCYATMLRTEQYKLIVYHTLDAGELYDVINDPAEQINLWNDQAYHEIRFDLLMHLSHRMAFTADPLPEREAPW
jgi:arylsulfatase